ncbi:MAG: chemotaxis protein CheA, partial [Gammaproteobacteria bacterium]
GAPADVDEIAATSRRLEAQLHGGDAAGAAPGPAAAVAAPAVTGWRVRFVPAPHLFQTGNDPARLLRELIALGPSKVECELAQLPASIEEFDPETCYLAWTVELDNDVPESAVREVFEWVDNDAEISIAPLAVDDAPAADAARSAPTAALAVARAPEDRRHGDDRRQQEDRRQGDRRQAPAAGTPSTSSIRVDIDKVDALINMVGELVITQSMLSQLAAEFDVALIEKLRAGVSQLERNTRELQESVMSIRMMPISFSFNRFPRLVRDLSAKLGKQVNLKMAGENTELDKTVLEKIGDPLVHLVRNALDHGIEPPDVRLACGKPAAGTLTLHAYHEGSNIVIEIIDDGAGLNRDRILAKARERGIVGEHDQLSEEQICDLVFAPGFSTAAVVSDVSGRGVGMDVVRRNIKDLGGVVEVESMTGAGSVFRIRLPLTLAILDGQLVRVGSEVYIVSLVSIIESLQVKAEAVSSVAGQTELYRLRDEYLPIVRLYDLFDVEPDSENLGDGLLVIVEAEGRKVGLFVDDLLGQQQVVIKSLQTNFRRVDGISGATILGDGKVAMILDTAGLIQLSRTQYQPSKLWRAERRVA